MYLIFKLYYPIKAKIGMGKLKCHVTQKHHHTMLQYPTATFKVDWDQKAGLQLGIHETCALSALST
jgi:hypothetical protein